MTYCDVDGNTSSTLKHCMHPPQSDLNEAQRLLTASRESLSAERSNEQTDMISAIYGRIAQYVRLRKEELIQNRVRVIVFADIAKVVRVSEIVGLQM